MNSTLWDCDNGCTFAGVPGDFIQMSSVDGDRLMLVCEECVHDPELEEWAVDFGDDPRDWV